jgi:hypothetical protein
MTYRRGWIVVFLFSLSMTSYMDRIALSIAAKPIATEFKLTAVEMGFLFSSFMSTPNTSSSPGCGFRHATKSLGVRFTRSSKLPTVHIN